MLLRYACPASYPEVNLACRSAIVREDAIHRRRYLMTYLSPRSITAFQHLSRAAGSFFGQPLSLPDARALINEGTPDGIISHRRKPAKHDRRREHCHHALPSCPGLIPFQQLLAIPV